MNKGGYKGSSYKILRLGIVKELNIIKNQEKSFNN